MRVSAELFRSNTYAQLFRFLFPALVLGGYIQQSQCHLLVQIIAAYNYYYCVYPSAISSHDMSMQVIL